MSPPAVVFYGNCQAQHLGECFRNLPGVSHRYRIETLLNVIVPGGPEMVSPPQDLLDRCEVLLLQVETKRDDPEFVASSWREVRPSFDFQPSRVLLFGRSSVSMIATIPHS